MDKIVVFHTIGKELVVTCKGWEGTYSFLDHWVYSTGNRWKGGFSTREEALEAGKKRLKELGDG